MIMTMDIPAVDVYFRMELCTLIWLYHNYGDRELWIYRRWMHISKWRYVHQYFWVRLANNFFG
jgi:hypothetical protein